MNKADQAQQLRDIEEAAQSLVDAASEAADAFESEDREEYTKDDRDALLDEAENAVSELLLVVPAAWKKGIK